MPARASAASRSGLTVRTKVRSALLPLLGVAALALAACRERSPQRGNLPSASGAPLALAPPTSGHRLSAGPLSARLHLPGRTYVVIEFFNSSSVDLIVLRPGHGEPLVAVPGLPGMQVLPAALYRFQALSLGDRRIYRGRYAPVWGKPVDSANAAREKGAASDDTHNDLKVPAKGSARLTADLPFELEPGEYWLAFSYDYFTSSAAVPVGWFTGQVEAAPIRIAVGPKGELSLLDGQRGADERSLPNVSHAGLGVTLRVATADVIEARFTNSSKAARVLTLPVDRAVQLPFAAPEFKWEAIASTTGEAFRHRIGVHTPRPDEPEACQPINSPQPAAPPETALVIPAGGETTLRLELPLKLPKGDYIVRFGYENMETLSTAQGEAVSGSLVSAPLSLQVSR